MRKKFKSEWTEGQCAAELVGQNYRVHAGHRAHSKFFRAENNAHADIYSEHAVLLLLPSWPAEFLRAEDSVRTTKKRGHAVLRLKTSESADLNQRARRIFYKMLKFTRVHAEVLKLARRYFYRKITEFQRGRSRYSVFLLKTGAHAGLNQLPPRFSQKSHRKNRVHAESEQRTPRFLTEEQQTHCQNFKSNQSKIKYRCIIVTCILLYLASMDAHYNSSPHNIISHKAIAKMEIFTIFT